MEFVDGAGRSLASMLGSGTWPLAVAASSSVVVALPLPAPPPPGTDRVRVTVPVELRNSPKVTGGGVLDQPYHTLHVECSPVKIPETIRIDITNLTLGHPIHVKELQVPDGVKLLDPPEAVVVQLKLPGVEAAAPVVAAEPGAHGRQHSVSHVAAVTRVEAVEQ